MQNIHISTTIKNLCKTKGISITSLLKECNLTKSFIYDLEKRSTSPSCAKIATIADYLECSVDYLLGRTDIPEVNRGVVDEDYEYDRPIPYIAAYSGDVAYDGESIPLEDIKELNESEDEA